MSIVRTRVSRAELAEAAAARAAGAAKTGYLTRSASQRLPGSRSVPPVDQRRETAFPATMRADKVTYNGQQLHHLSGIASVTDVRYQMWDMFGPYDEIMDGGAFDKTLANSPDVQFLVNHKGLAMARTIPMPGRQPTLILAKVAGPEPTDNGLGMDAYLNGKRTDVSDLIVAVDDYQITEMSFAFMLLEGWWSDDFMTYKITEVDIDRGDVSAVNKGANPWTSIGARQQEILDQVRAMPASLVRAVWSELGQRPDVDMDLFYAGWKHATERDRAAAAAASAGKRAIAIAIDTDDDDDEDEDTMACPSCGAGNATDALYCDQCGASMTGAQPMDQMAAAGSAQRGAGSDSPRSAGGYSLTRVEAMIASVESR
jgi:HK97 family phage prohead protease